MREIEQSEAANICSTGLWRHSPSQFVEIDPVYVNERSYRPALLPFMIDSVEVDAISDALDKYHMKVDRSYRMASIFVVAVCLVCVLGVILVVLGKLI